MPRTGFENSVVDTLYFAARPEQAGQFSKWSRYAQRQGSRERTLRNRPAPLQAHLREGRRARRNPQARVLRKADPGTQAQARRGREAPPSSPLARSDAPRTLVLIGGRKLLRSAACTPAVPGILTYRRVHSGSCAPPTHNLPSLATLSNRSCLDE